MEMLEGKYFEKPINLLKDLKNEENIFLRPEFRERLRGQLLEKAMASSDEAGIGWMDFVFKMKYLFVGTPVLILLAIVVTNYGLSRVELGSQAVPASEIQSEASDVMSLNSGVEPVSSFSKMSNVVELDEKDMYINPILEREHSVRDFSVDLSDVGFVLSPQYLEEVRVYFQGEERSELWSVLSNEFELRNGNLSNDYQIVVLKLEDGNYKAVLFEYGLVQRVLILGYRAEGLVVLTELIY